MPIKPLALRTIKATFKVGTDEYTEHLTSWEFSPNTPIQSLTDISGKVHKIAPDESDWTLNLGLTQDFSATGLALFMFQNQGVSAAVTIVDGPATWASTVTFVPPSIGGAGATIGASTVALPASEPVYTATV